jgi:hypothetical protein
VQIRQVAPECAVFRVKMQSLKSLAEENDLIALVATLLGARWLSTSNVLDSEAGFILAVCDCSKGLYNIFSQDRSLIVVPPRLHLNITSYVSLVMP